MKEQLKNAGIGDDEIAFMEHRATTLGSWGAAVREQMDSAVATLESIHHQLKLDPPAGLLLAVNEFRAGLKARRSDRVDRAFNRLQAALGTPSAKTGACTAKKAAAGAPAGCSLGQWSGECELALNAGKQQTIRFNNRDYTPDDSTAYVDFHLSYAFPKGYSVYGDALLPDVVLASAESMKDKPFNLGHKVKSYAPDAIHRDRIVGNIRDVEVVMEGGLPHLHVLASLFKAAEGVDRIMGQHGTGRHKWSVSLEFLYYAKNSGFLIQRPAGGPAKPLPTTPTALAQQGWDYVPLQAAGAELEVAGEEFAGLAALRDFKRRRFNKRHASVPYAGDWNGRAVYFAMNGLNTAGHFSGVGLVEYGAEVTAHIERMLASDDRAGDAFAQLAASVKVFEKFGVL